MPLEPPTTGVLPTPSEIATLIAEYDDVATTAIDMRATRGTTTREGKTAGREAVEPRGDSCGTWGEPLYGDTLG
jgi:hypothetical protein